MTAEYIVCLEDGKKFKSLKRHLRTQYALDAGPISRQMELAAGLSDGKSHNYAQARLRSSPSKWGLASSAAVAATAADAHPTLQHSDRALAKLSRSVRTVMT